MLLGRRPVLNWAMLLPGRRPMDYGAGGVFPRVVLLSPYAPTDLSADLGSCAQPAAIATQPASTPPRPSARVLCCVRVLLSETARSLSRQSVGNARYLRQVLRDADSPRRCRARARPGHDLATRCPLSCYALSAILLRAVRYLATRCPLYRDSLCCYHPTQSGVLRQRSC
eukprot:1756195-Rhodomonas_salina.1